MPRAAAEPPYFGPYSAADPEIQGLLKTRALAVIKERIKERLTALAPPQPLEKLPSHCDGHEETSAKEICTVGEKGKAGRWFQVCLTCKRRDKKKQPRIHYVTDRLDPILLTGDSDLAKWFKIRAEIKAFTPRGQGRATRAPPIMLPEGPHHPSPPPGDPQEEEVPPAAPPSPGPLDPPDEEAFSALDLSFPIDLVVYITPDTERNNAVVEEKIFARHNHCVHLSDFKALLGSKGLYQQGLLEIYDFLRDSWVECRWDTPHFIPSKADAMLTIRYNGLTV